MGKAGIKTQIFVNECSLQGQFQTIKDFEHAVKEFRAIFADINKNQDLYKELYKNELFIQYEAIKSSSFQATLNQIKDKSLKTAFIQLLFNKLNPINWRNQQVHQLNDEYVLAESSQKVTDTSIAEIAERKLQQKESAYLLVNFQNSNFNSIHPDFSLCQFIAVLKNQDEVEIVVDCLDNRAAFEQWVLNKLDERSFLERNSRKYNRSKNIVQGQPVYVEREAGNYWYLDNLHKDHFEVFSPQGEHLGEANLQGILDTTKKDCKKRYKN